MLRATVMTLHARVSQGASMSPGPAVWAGSRSHAGQSVQDLARIGSDERGSGVASSYGRLASGVRKELADDLPRAVDPGEQKVVDEGHTSPISLLRDRGCGGVTG